MDNYEIEMQADLILTPYMRYKKENDTVLFNGKSGSKQLVNQQLKVLYTIVDSSGNKFEQVQSIQVVASAKELKITSDEPDQLSEQDVAEPESEL